jgi:hypothetical protein
MKRLIVILLNAALAFGLAIPVFGAAPAAQPSAKRATAASKEHHYYGDISDSNCGAHHKMGLSPRECTLACVKHGAKYVLVSRGHILKIANQDNPGLEKYAGEHVRVTGKRSHDTLTIASIAPVKRRIRAKKASK